MTALDVRHDLDPTFRRRRFTATEVEAMCDEGFFDEGPRYELLDGELIEMAAQGPLHRTLESKLLNWIARRLPEEIEVAANGPIRLGQYDEPEPDLFLFPARFDVNAVRGADAELVIEVANSSLKRDLGFKADIYARESVRRYWVVDVANKVTWVHSLEDNRYGKPHAVAFAEPLKVPGIETPLIVADLLG